ncbi:MAG: hypothetical protein KDE26_18605, partial [Bacteroidetes bacterium]|nr:hypothetical protein [Bacteroidota bacterium]
MKKIIFLSLILSGLAVSGFAQTYQEKLDRMRERIEMKLDNQQKRVDLQFSNQLRRMWVQMQFQQPEDRPSIPEPTDPRVYNPATNIHQGEVELRVDPNFDPSPQYVESPVKDVKKNLIPRPAPSKEQDVAVNEFVKDRAKKMDREVRVFYFGKSLKMKYDSKMEISSPRTLSSNSIAEHWEGLEEAPHEFLIYQLTNEAKIMNLNDWGFALLINETGKQIYPGDKNAQIMFNWFCLSKAGYMSTVSYERDQLYLMLPAYQVLYGKSFLRGKDHKLYAIDLDGGNPQLSRARVFQAAHPEAKKVMDFSVNSTPDFPESLRRK